MKRFWKWITNQKISTIRKWQSVVLHPDRDHQQDEKHLKSIGGSDDEMERKQKRNSRILQEDNDDYNTNISLQDFDISHENQPVDFEEFFEESPVAVESAMERKHATSSVLSRKKLTTTTKISLSLSLDDQSGSFRRKNRPIRSTISTTNMDNDNDSSDARDDFYDEFDEITPSSHFANHRRATAVSQMSTSFSGEPSNFLAAISDESTNAPSSSSLCSYQPDTTIVNIAPKNGSQIIKHRPLVGVNVSFHKKEKDKLDDGKKKLSLQHFRHAQVEQLLIRHRSTETLPPLTSAQIHLVRNIWRQVYITKGPTVIGSTILHGIYFKSKKIKEQFFRCSFPHRFTNRDSFNKAHAKAVGEMFDKASVTIVDNLENLESISTYLFAVGAMHGSLALQQLSKEIWNLMAEAFIDCTLDWGDKKCRTEASRKAWVFIIAFIIEKIKEGHLHERRQLAYQKRSSLVASSRMFASSRMPSSTVSLPSSAPTIKFWRSAEESDPNIQMF